MRTEVLEGIRLSPQQKYLWLLQQENNNQQPYRSQCAVLIEGSLNTAILKQALQEIVNRQEIFRTNFKCLPGMNIPVQVITDGSILWQEECNLSDYSPSQQEIEIDKNFAQMLQLPFNLEQNSIVYASLFTLSSQKYLLIISLPALCADSATLRNLVRELSNYYQLFSTGEESSDDSIQYADIAEWQNELLEAEDTKIGREYWRKQDIFQFLDLHLPLENKQEVDSDLQPQVFSVKINPEITEKILSLAQEYQTSVDIFLLTCWQILLMRLTGQPDIVIGMASDGRQYEELSSALGLLTKYLPLHCYLSESSQIKNILNYNNKSIAEIYEWQDSFNWELISNINIASYCPFGFESNLQPASYCNTDVKFSIYKQYICTDRFKVKCSCWYQNDALIVDFYYDSHLFSAETIQSVAGNFETLLKSTVNQPSATISELEILNFYELQQLLVEFNNTQVDYPKNKCIHQLFEEQVEKAPNKIAVSFNNQKLTYSELNIRANQLAHYLRQLGVKPEVLVGICVERSLDMIVGILGILKAGGAYLPLDPKYPKERLEFLLLDTQTPVLLTQQHLVENLPEHKAKLICLDAEWDIITQQNSANPITEVTSENLVYVIYTSGSTGKPKGVKITHRNLVHSTIARINYYQEPLTSFLLLSSFAFDSSVAGIFWTLCQGGTLFFPQEGGELDLPELIELIAQNQISHTLTLPSLYALLLEQAQPEKLASLRTVIVAGEPCPKILVMRHWELRPNTSLFNEYGPTEGTVWSTVYHCHRTEIGTQISIGRPIANTQIYLLDSHLHPVPLGVAGELYISGEGLAQGYLNRPDLTAQKFIPNPFSNQEGVRLYKTGDLARYLPNGNIEFLGRIDQQVKIRGFRIELSEIEAVLSQHPQVRSLVVIAREDEPGNKRLVAYIVPHQEYSPTSDELRHFLQEKLPEYMMPSAFVQLDSLPHLPNGKVDIKALPAPEKIKVSANFVAPRTPVEEAIAQIWSEILGVEQVGIHDRFFELGGHSLLATQVISRLRQTLQVELPLRQFFDAPTVADLAVMVAQTLAQQTDEAMLSEMLAELEADNI
ncbi:amino acid adenylation domain-containing protein [Nostoc sp. FACHB-152]|uniref:non-ribosomal peptide synthetase n=1 Tax=unclassified Nostoc TaxID=2593658 RepID=UPI001685E571|nr:MULTISPECIES: non-ribosomal peptide synthetase [unclassified Nostoc]MBD2448896.1 amino acid adenylation domain-containing protein [Nostoc sp. FACHB-152]MBD2472685.1 amino acid adenylation domain-containing protein [Nostoc sp. FACHB-145]